MSESKGLRRRGFLQSVALASAVPPADAQTADAAKPAAAPSYPRTFTGPQLAMISFPLGGVGAGSIGLGGRGQLRDWEIANRTDKGNSPAYAMPSIWAQSGSAKPVARVLEARFQPPYEGQNGLGSRNAPGLSRLEGATFTGEFPLARIDFHDRTLPVAVSLEAGTPFIPLDADASGLPMTVLRYRVRNRGRAAASVAIALSIENPVTSLLPQAQRRPATRASTNRARAAASKGSSCTIRSSTPPDPLTGQFRARRAPARRRRSHDAARLAGRTLVEQSAAVLGRLHCRRRARTRAREARHCRRGVSEAEDRGRSGGGVRVRARLAFSRIARRSAAAGRAPKGHEKDVIGNWYATRFADAWAVAEHAAANVDELGRRTQRFVDGRARDHRARRR